jgi:hypothetical protein
MNLILTHFLAQVHLIEIRYISAHNEKGIYHRFVQVMCSITNIKKIILPCDSLKQKVLLHTPE